MFCRTFVVSGVCLPDVEFQMVLDRSVFRTAEEPVRLSFVFRMAGVEEKINLQRDGGKAKPYQVKQVRNVILKYKLGE